MSIAPKTPVDRVVLDLAVTDAADVAELATRLLDEQREVTGVTYAYCDACHGAVHPGSARASVAAGRRVLCRACARRAPKSRDATVYLCQVCRTPLEGRRRIRARSAAKRGFQTTCGRVECSEAVLKAKRAGGKPASPCAVCGQPASKKSSTESRSTGRPAYCDAHKRRRNEGSRRAVSLVLSGEAIGVLRAMASARSMSAVAEEAILAFAGRGTRSVRS